EERHHGVPTRFALTKPEQRVERVRIGGVDLEERLVDLARHARLAERALREARRFAQPLLLRVLVALDVGPDPERCHELRLATAAAQDLDQALVRLRELSISVERCAETSFGGWEIREPIAVPTRRAEVQIARELVVELALV